jgi:MFS family permease
VIPALRNRNYRVWITGLSLANVGTWMQRIAQDWLVLELTHGSGTALGVVTALQFVPMLLLGPFGGVIADRFPKRWTLLWSQAAVGVCGLVVGVTVVAHQASLIEVQVVAVLLGVANAVLQPTVQAFLLELVDREEVASVVGLSGGAFHAARLVGPGVAGLLIDRWGTGPVFLLAAVTVLGPITSLIRLDPRTMHVSPAVRGGPRMFVAGLRYAMRERRIRLILGVAAFAFAFAANSQVTNALMATVVFHRGASGFGLLGSLMAVGSIAAAAFVTLRRRGVNVTMVLGAAVALCVFNGLSGLAPGYLPFAVVLVPVAFAQIMLTVTAISVLQLESAPEYRGRVVALFTVLMMGTAPVTAPLVGWWAQHVGIRSAVVMTSVVALLGTVTVIAAMSGRRRPIPQEADQSSSREATVIRP